MWNEDVTPAEKFTHLKELVIVLLHFHIADGAYEMSTRGQSGQSLMDTHGKRLQPSNGLCDAFSFSLTVAT